MEFLRGTKPVWRRRAWIYQRSSAYVWIILSWIVCCECFKEKNLTIGGIFPMVGGWGGGVGCLPAVEMALEDINNSTDVLPNYQLWMVEKDSQCMPGLGTKVLYELLYTHPTKIMVLTGCSSVSTFVAQAAKMWNLVVLGYGSSSPALSNRDRFPTFFRTHPSATIHNPTRVRLFKKFNWSQIATIQETLEVFQSTVEDLEERVKDAGIDIVVRQSFLTDPTNAVKNLKRQDARIIVGVFYEDMARRVFCQVYKEKLYGRKYVWFIIGWYPDNWYASKDENIDCTPDQMREALEGHFTTEAIMLTKKSTVTRSNMTSQQFKERLDRKLNVTETAQVPGYPEAPLAYDAVWALALALNKASSRLKRRGMKLEDFDYTNKEITDEIYSAMNSTKFLGVSGEVAFSSSGDRIACTQIEQMINGVYHQVGEYDSMADNLTWLDNEIWIGGSPPPDRTKTVKFQRVVSPGVFFAMCGLATLGITAGVAALIFNTLNRHRRLIAMSQPNVNSIMVCGCILCLLCIYLLGLDGQFVSVESYPRVCMARAWLLSFGFTFGYGSMFSKVWTVHRVTTLRKKNRRKVRVWEFYVVLAFIFVLDVIVLTTWQAVDPMFRYLEYFPYEDPQDTDEDIKYQPQLEHCTSNNLTVWLGITFGYKGVLLILGVFLAYETRSVKIKQINDSRFVGMSIYNVVVMCVITAPITLLISSQQNATFVFVSLAIILCSFLSIGLIFIPKVIQLVRNPHKEGIEIKAMSDSMASREEEERHQRLLMENEELKQHIAEREDKIRELNRRVLSKSQPKCVTIQTEESSDILVDHNPNPAKTNACVVSFTNLSPLTIGGGSPEDLGVSIDADSGLASSSMAKSSKNSASDSEPYC